MKYIVVSGGVLSGIGKGIVASSTGLLLDALGFKVTSIKIDPYLNIDAGTMSPFEHGEVFVLDDGGEADLDLGNYERFIGGNLTRDNNITTGKIYHHVIQKERKGEYLGKTVQVVPHICDEIQAWIERVARVPIDDKGTVAEICVIELGGTIGDIESMPFIEAIRQLQFRVGKHNFASIHVSLVPIVGAVGEQKTKPTQASVRELRALGISPDIIVCRSSEPLTKSVSQKISSFCGVTVDHVISCHDVNNIYEVPLMLQPQGLPQLLLKKLNAVAPKESDLKRWTKMAERYTQLTKVPTEKAIHIALVGKYTNLSDAYSSVISSLQHASMKINERVVIDFIEASYLEDEAKSTDKDKYDAAWKILKSANGILVPGGFGDRGIEGMILAIQYARTQKVPYFGICLGLQVAVIETCRNSSVNWKGANSSEFDENAEKKVVIFMPEIDKTQMGGNMRLGKRISKFTTTDSSIMYKLYGSNETIEERHRHRYEVNPEYVDHIEKNSNLRFVAKDFETGKRMEIIEMLDHPYFVGVQFHPEFKSRPLKPSPPFVGLLLASCNRLNDWMEKKKSSLTTSLDIRQSQN